MSEASETRILVLGLPGGVFAAAMSRADGSLPRDRRGRVKVAQVRVTANGDHAQAVPGAPIDGFSERDRDWITAKARRYWSSILQRFGTRARAMAMRLAGAGVVDLVCTVDDDLQIGLVKHWQLTAPWEDHRLSQSASEHERTAQWRIRANAAAESCSKLDPGLSTALLNTRANNTRLPVLVHAAEDLAAGIAHDGPRAFSQAHFNTTKERDDVAAILTDHGADPATLVFLGLLRSPYIGLGGAMTVDIGGGQVNLSLLDGPVQFRMANRRISPHAMDETRDLAIIENLQAAETTCDRFPDVAVIWCAGQPSNQALHITSKLAADVERVLIATDADLGGVRIANRIAVALTGHPQIEIIDVGKQPHPRRDPFGAASIEALRILAETHGPADRFARACLERGYPVEQEAATRKAIHTALTAP